MKLSAGTCAAIWTACNTFSGFETLSVSDYDVRQLDGWPDWLSITPVDGVAHVCADADALEVESLVSFTYALRDSRYDTKVERSIGVRVVGELPWTIDLFAGTGAEGGNALAGTPFVVLQESDPPGVAINKGWSFAGYVDGSECGFPGLAIPSTVPQTQSNADGELEVIAPEPGCLRVDGKATAGEVSDEASIRIAVYEGLIADFVDKDFVYGSRRAVLDGSMSRADASASIDRYEWVVEKRFHRGEAWEAIADDFLEHRGGRCGLALEVDAAIYRVRLTVVDDSGRSATTVREINPNER